jgi:branched-chain amino acid transport system permease protein
LILGIVEAFSVASFSSGLKDIIVFSILIMVLILRPTGLFRSIADEET